MLIKRTLSALLIIVSLVTLFGCDGEKVNTLSHCEFRMPLPDEYSAVESNDYDAVYSNGSYMIALTRISFIAGMMGEGIPETLTEVEFAELYLEKCSREASVINDGVTYVEYYDMSGNDELFYLEAFYRSPYAYFVVLFVSGASLEDSARPEFLDFAESVYFTT